ncbi:MAG: TetR/AcrR family transcriptional regulator [Pseudomonadota bacterium]
MSTELKKMGRKKSYDREELIGKAVDLFRDHGYANTTAEKLSSALGVNRYGIYAEFGSKQGLFEAALKRYEQENVERNFGPLERPGAGVDEIRTLFEFFGQADRSPAFGRGCLLCNTAVEFGPDDPGGDKFIAHYFKRIENAFLSALQNAASEGEINDTVDVSKEADFFTATVLGLFVMLRAQAPARLIKNAVDSAVEHLNLLTRSH